MQKREDEGLQFVIAAYELAKLPVGGIGKEEYAVTWERIRRAQANYKLWRPCPAPRLKYRDWMKQKKEGCSLQ